MFAVTAINAWVRACLPLHADLRVLQRRTCLVRLRLLQERDELKHLDRRQ
jgi:hypothetical protein